MRGVSLIIVCLTLISCSLVKYENGSGKLSRDYPASTNTPETCGGYGFRVRYINQGNLYEKIAEEAFYLRPGKYSIGYYHGKYGTGKGGVCALLEQVQPHGRYGAYWGQLEVQEGCDVRLVYLALAGRVVGVQECNNHT